MKTVYPNQLASLTVTVYDSTSTPIAATLSVATMTANGHTITATITGQVLTAIVPADMPLGAGSLVWAWGQVAGGVTSSETVTEAVTVVDPTVQPVYHTDVYSLIRDDLLRVDSNALPDPAIDSAFARVRRDLLARFPCLVSYEALTGNDAAWFDEAASYMVAVQRFDVKYSAGAAGLLTSEATPDFKYTYSTGNRDERDEWTDAAAKTLGRITCIAAGRRAASVGVSVFGMVGRRRTLDAACAAYGRPLLSSVLDIYGGWL